MLQLSISSMIFLDENWKFQLPRIQLGCGIDSLFLHNTRSIFVLYKVHRLRAKIHQNKPIYTGFSILEISKVHMYRFHYDVVLAKYGQDCRLLYRHPQFMLQHTDERPLRWHDYIFGSSRYQLLSQRPPRTLKCWENSKTSVTVLPPRSSLGFVPRCTHC